MFFNFTHGYWSIEDLECFEATKTENIFGVVRRFCFQLARDNLDN